MLVTESNNEIKLVLHHPMGLRIFLFLFGFIPVLAPYELLLKPRWNEYGFAFFFFAFISLAALSISILLWTFAIGGRDKTYSFLKDRRELVVIGSGPFVKTKTQRYLFSEIGEIRFHAIDWSEGEPSSYLRVLAAGSEQLLEDIGPFTSKESAQRTSASLQKLMQP